MHARRITSVYLIVTLQIMTVFWCGNAYAAKLWSTSDSYLGPGDFHGPGMLIAKQPLFELELNNLSFFTDTDFLMPFVNNGSAEPNICGEKEFRGNVDGRMSNGIRINENADMCSGAISGRHVMFGVIEGGPHMGQQINVVMSDGNIVMTMDLAFDLGIGDEGVIKLPFYGTTGEVEVPLSLQTQQGKEGVDQAGKFASGTKLKGRIGDFNNDGWVDGTLVAAGNIPLESPVSPGQPYMMQRNFETDIPVNGVLYGNVKGLHENKRITLWR